MTEDVITELDGYQWSNPKPGHGDCRGCELQGMTGRPCPLHSNNQRGNTPHSEGR